MKIELRGLEDTISDLRKLWKDYPEAVERSAEDRMWIIVAELESRTVQLTPAGVGGAAGLRGSIFGEAVRKPGRVTGLWGSPLKYAEVVELGRRPGSFPPPSALVLWVRRKLGVSHAQASGVAHAIAWKIYRKGTEPVKMFEKAWDASEIWVGQQIAQIGSDVRLGG